MPGPPERIFLIGLSGAGKSTAGRLAADQLGWAFLDTDDMVEAEAGRSVPEVFEAEGEPAFRERESRALREAASRDRVVVATGGGAVTTPAGRDTLATGFRVWLEVAPATAAARLEGDAAATARPLLAGGAEQRLGTLLDERADRYAESDARIAVDGLSTEQAASEIVRAWQEASRRAAIAAVVTTPQASYPIYVHDGVLHDLGAICRDVGLDGRAFVLTDEHVAPKYGGDALSALAAAGYAADLFAIPAGEEQKTLATVQRVWDWLLAARVERSDFAVCLGGGVVTDLGGFAAATCLRGIAFVHVPTTLLGMVDASVGGKTGVDHPRGKNLIGAFAQPAAVVIDPQVLRSLPLRELRAGWAEVVKHGLILDEQLTRDLEACAEDPQAMFSPFLIARSVAIKAAVVSEDEREAGKRTLLNYGHTIGHAIEAVTGYSAYLHGEAIAVGMHAAGLIARELGLLSADDFTRQQRLLRACGLPERAPGVSVDAVLEATLSDKKVRAGSVNWVLLRGVGDAVTRNDVPLEVVRRAVETVLR